MTDRHTVTRQARLGRPDLPRQPNRKDEAITLIRTTDTFLASRVWTIRHASLVIVFFVQPTRPSRTRCTYAMAERSGQ